MTMDEMKLFYSIVQFSPFPERFEYVNAGVVVFESRQGKVFIKITDDFSRLKKIFGDINVTFLKSALHDFSQRVVLNFSHPAIASKWVHDFNSKRADLFQLTPLNAVAGNHVYDVAEKLFNELVAWHPSSKKVERINTLLTDAFRETGVLPLLDKRPEPVHIAQYGVNVQADYGYQNGVYNLIDAARFDNPQRNLAEAGKRILEGKALSEMLGKRLIVVAEFGDQPENFVSNLRNDFESVNAKLFRLDEVEHLAREIRQAAH
ncbi:MULTISPECIES: DUF3037 domain-containing protein [Rhizobium/Agrobacterium group]|uniref:DUF3037 domain-containing protein n=1 Tax=Rhizobium/Agrobacterium group TaxID=227290 RepID=UPI001F1896AB|nr:MULTISPECIES: DUF3037 domain-containing protein [Rhizobium/Agrobacterium group]